MPSKARSSGAFLLTAWISGVVGTLSAAPAAAQARTSFADRCATLAHGKTDRPIAGTRQMSAEMHSTGEVYTPPTAPGAPPPLAQSLPVHCEITAVIRPRRGIDGKTYAIRFRLRLPEQWNGRFLFQGGGGSNGIVGDAIGNVSPGQPSALAQGFAILAQDSGHDNATNTDPRRGGLFAFGFDPQARADYGGTSLQPVTLAAKALIARFYGRAPSHSYFVGCSKGGQEGMMLAQRYPTLYDGIVAGAPGFALPRAAVAEAWNTNAFADVLRSRGQAVTVASLASTFSMAELQLVRKAVLDACDNADGLTDGIVGNFRECTSVRVLPQLRAAGCRPNSTEPCLSNAQIAALVRVHEGPRDGRGRQIYPGFPWDAGWSDMGWRIWMIGTPDGHVPPINVAVGAFSLSSTFMTPPRAIGATPQDGLNFQTAFDFNRDTGAIYARAGAFPRSAWQDIGARSANLSVFRARGGKLIVPHGVSDPVFSINDTLDWWQEVDLATHGKAADFARVFPVPGMTHCGGGPATDQFDALGALTRWVEHGTAPEMLTAVAGPGSPWPGRTRPLCRFPLIAGAQTGADGKNDISCMTTKSGKQ